MAKYKYTEHFVTFKDEFGDIRRISRETQKRIQKAAQKSNRQRLAHARKLYNTYHNRHNEDFKSFVKKATRKGLIRGKESQDLTKLGNRSQMKQTLKHLEKTTQMKTNPFNMNKKKEDWENTLNAIGGSDARAHKLADRISRLSQDNARQIFMLYDNFVEEMFDSDEFTSEGVDGWLTRIETILDEFGG